MSETKDITTREESMPDSQAELRPVAPLVDIYENDEDILLHADMPGVGKNDISLNIENGKLEISAVRKLETKGATGWEEFGNVVYRRVFSIPQTINIEGVNAELNLGILKLHLPKSAAAKPRQIEIRTS